MPGPYSGRQFIEKAVGPFGVIDVPDILPDAFPSQQSVVGSLVHHHHVLFSGHGLSVLLQGNGNIGRPHGSTAAQARTDAGLWGSENEWEDDFLPAQGESGGLNLMWGDYQATIEYEDAARMDAHVVSAGYQAFIENGDAHDEAEAENILREFYGLPKPGEHAIPQGAVVLNFEDFLR